MSTLRLPAVDPTTVPEQRGSGYPDPFRSQMGERAKRKLGDACRLGRVGVNLVTPGPGGQSALRHRRPTSRSATGSRATTRSVPTTI